MSRGTRLEKIRALRREPGDDEKVDSRVSIECVDTESKMVDEDISRSFTRFVCESSGRERQTNDPVFTKNVSHSRAIPRHAQDYHLSFQTISYSKIQLPAVAPLDVTTKSSR